MGDNIKLPKEGNGPKVRTTQTTVGTETVHEQVVQIANNSSSIINPAKEDGNLATIAGKDFATQTTLALIKAKTDNIDVLLSTRTKPDDIQNISGTITANGGTNLRRIMIF